MTQIIDQLPLPVPSRTDPTNFSVRADNFLGELPDFATQVNALATELTALGNTVETNKNTAVTASNNAQASAFAATGSANNAASSSGAALWVSGTTYSIGNLVYSPITGRTYRRKIAGAGTTDPSADATNWIPIVLEISTQYPTIRPSLNLDFVNNKYLDPRITFTRSSTAKYFDGKTVHKAEENLLIKSEEFDNVAWTKTNATITANTQVNPSGQSTADTLTETTATGQHSVRQPFASLASQQYVLSFFIKYSTIPFVQLAFDNGFDSQSYANFNIQTGVTGTIGTSTTASITSFGNGWYRCSILCTATSNSTNAGAYVLLANSSSMIYGGSYTGSTSNSVYLFGAQVEQRSSVGPYLATTTQPITNYQSTLVTAAIDQPRFDHDPITKLCNGLFIEDASTNLVTYSEDITNASWTKQGVTASLYGSTAPDGASISKYLIVDTSAGNHYLYQNVTPTSGVSYTLSTYAKAITGRYLYLGVSFTGGGRFQFDLVTGTLLNGSGVSASQAGITSVGNGWYRVFVTVTASSSSAGQVQIGIDNDSDTSAINYTGDGYAGISLWGIQLESNSITPSSYISTSGATANRSYDNAVVSGSNFLSWYNQEEGTTFVETLINQKPLSSYYNCNAFSISSNADNLLTMLVNTNFYPETQLTYNTNLSGFALNSSTYSFGTTLRMSASFGQNNLNTSYNSGTIVSDTDCILNKQMNTLNLGQRTAGVHLLRGYLRRFTYYSRRLSNTELQTLTAL